MTALICRIVHVKNITTNNTQFDPLHFVQRERRSLVGHLEGSAEKSISASSTLRSPKDFKRLLENK